MVQHAGDRPLSLAGLRGHVVLVDFWTYTCINCIRTLPYLESWYRKYRRDGFTVVGVHTPEFPFEKEASNVQRAIGDDGLTYPVAQDNDAATWTAYHNQYWPADYLIDAQGRVRLVHFGEGSYAETEGAIRSLLAEAGGAGLGGRANVRSQTPDPRSTPESYLGAARADRFANGQIRPGTQSFQAVPAGLLGPDQLAYGGQWTISGESATAGTTPAWSSTSTRGGCSVCSARRPGRERCGCSSTAARSRTHSPARTSTAARRRSLPSASTALSTCRIPGDIC